MALHCDCDLRAAPTASEPRSRVAACARPRGSTPHGFCPRDAPRRRTRARPKARPQCQASAPPRPTPPGVVATLMQALLQLLRMPVAMLWVHTLRPTRAFRGVRVQQCRMFSRTHSYLMEWFRTSKGAIALCRTEAWTLKAGWIGVGVYAAGCLPIQAARRGAWRLTYAQRRPCGGDRLPALHRAYPHRRQC